MGQGLDHAIMASNSYTGLSNLIFYVLTITIMGLLLSNSFAMSCKGDTFKIYYVPIEAQFYVPLTPEDIEKKGDQLIIKSCEISKLFDAIKKNNFDVADNDDFTGLRIKIINMTDGKELYITTEKNIITENRRYKIDKKTMDAALKVIVDSLKQNKEGKGSCFRVFKIRHPV